MKVKDGIIGLIVGDALGVPVEFMSRETLKAAPITKMEGHGTYNQPAGTWSDDSSMTIATMQSIINKGGIDYEDIMNEFYNWYSKDMYTPHGDVFDCGITTSHAIINYSNGNSALNCGESGERSNGNGSLMRILPLAYIKDIDYETIENVSSLTHAHERSRIACVLYIEIAKSMIENEGLEIKDHIEFSCDKIKAYYNESQELKHFERIFNNDLEDVTAKGYVISTFESVIHCLLTTSNYRDAVLKAVNLGDDTDTVGAICGGLAGIYYGFDSIPVDWVGEISKINYLLSLCDKYEEINNES